MGLLSEITIYKVEKANIERVIEVSHSVIAEINSYGDMIVSYQIMQSIDTEDEVCWHLTWANEQAIALYKRKWESLSSTQDLMSLVGGKVYYGHFDIVASTEST